MNIFIQLAYAVYKGVDGDFFYVEKDLILNFLDQKHDCTESLLERFILLNHHTYYVRWKSNI